MHFVRYEKQNLLLSKLLLRILIEIEVGGFFGCMTLIN